MIRTGVCVDGFNLNSGALIRLLPRTCVIQKVLFFTARVSGNLTAVHRVGLNRPQGNLCFQSIPKG